MGSARALEGEEARHLRVFGRYDGVQAVVADLPVGVLVVDPSGAVLLDNARLREIYGGRLPRKGEELESEGFRTRGASNGREALERLRTFESGVVLLDLFMPVMSGWDVIEHLRHDRLLGRVPIAICTSSPAEAPAGFPVLPKPVDFEQMLTVIRDLANSREGR